VPEAAKGCAKWTDDFQRLLIGDEMVDIGFTLRAKNSSGDQTLTMAEHNGEYWFTLHGVYKGNAIQIDFDVLTKAQLTDLK